MYTLKNRDFTISEAELADLNQQAESKKSGMPREGQKYWYCDSYGDKGRDVWNKSRGDYHGLYSGNLFLTEEKCEEYLKYVNALKAITKFKIEAGLNDFKAEWEEDGKYNWQITLYVDRLKTECVEVTNYFNLLGYYASKEDAQKVIDNCKAEILIVANYQR